MSLEAIYLKWKTGFELSVLFSLCLLMFKLSLGMPWWLVCLPVSLYLSFTAIAGLFIFFIILTMWS